MVAWREAASDEAQSDLDGLLDEALTLAERRLSERGQFFPFGLVVDSSGATQLIAADAQAAQQAHESNIRAVAAMRAQVRAAALVVDVRLPETGGDGIEVFLEHAEGIALNVLEPYQLQGEVVVGGALEASTAQRRIW
ncbi:hypothetical protein AB0E01_31675 [Nocardia vinacea]|uniref:hypothetical protein n=1 Tax=Nocardia vinacea TaxID=96468 RepID=UPI0033F0D15D